MEKRLSILEQLSTIPKIPVGVMSVIHDESSTGIAAIAEAAHIGLTASPSSDDDSSATTKAIPSMSTTGALDSAVLPRSENTSWDNSSPPNSEKTSTPVASSTANWPESTSLRSQEAIEREWKQQILSCSAQDEETPLPVSVTLTLPTGLWKHLLIVAEGRGQDFEAMLSERYLEFRDLYGMI